MDIENLEVTDESQDTENTATETDGGNAVETEAPAAPEGTQADQEADAALENEGEENDADADGEDGEGGEVEAYKANTKIKVMDKEFDIPDKFHSLMDSPENEKLVRELFEKSHGLDVVKPKLQEVRTERDSFMKEANEYKAGIADLRSDFTKAVGPGGNILKLDNFFAKLQINPQVIMNYAYAKAQLEAADPQQRQMIESQLRAEDRADALARDTEVAQMARVSQERELKSAQLDFTLARDEYRSIAQAFDDRQGKPGSFKSAVQQMGHMNWLSSNGQVNMTAEQATLEVIKQYGLQAAVAAQVQPPAANGKAATPAAPNPGKPAVQRTDRTIPNVNGKSSTAVSKAKPRSIDDIKKLAARAAAGEQI